MCSSRGRLWISWGYAHDLRMMRQLAMVLKVCENSRFQQVAGLLGSDVLVVRSISWVSVHMYCMMHVLTNVGQVVKNLFPDSICLSIVVQVAWWSTTVNGEDDRN